MDTILIVCGAGASSTFLASRMRSIARERDISLHILPLDAEAMSAHLSSAAAVLVGPHLEAVFDDLRTAATAAHVPIALLPASAFRPSGAEFAIGMVSELLNTHTSEPDTAPTAQPN